MTARGRIDTVSVLYLIGCFCSFLWHGPTRSQGTPDFDYHIVMAIASLWAFPWLVAPLRILLKLTSPDPELRNEGVDAVAVSAGFVVAFFINYLVISLLFYLFYGWPVFTDDSVAKWLLIGLPIQFGILAMVIWFEDNPRNALYGTTIFAILLIPLIYLIAQSEPDPVEPRREYGALLALGLFINAILTAVIYAFGHLAKDLLLTILEKPKTASAARYREKVIRKIVAGALFLIAISYPRFFGKILWLTFPEMYISYSRFLVRIIFIPLAFGILYNQKYWAFLVPVALLFILCVMNLIEGHQVWGELEITWFTVSSLILILAVTKLIPLNSPRWLRPP